MSIMIHCDCPKTPKYGQKHGLVILKAWERDELILLYQWVLVKFSLTVAAVTRKGYEFPVMSRAESREQRAPGYLWLIDLGSQASPRQEILIIFQGRERILIND